MLSTLPSHKTKVVKLLEGKEEPAREGAMGSQVASKRSRKVPLDVVPNVPSFQVLKLNLSVS